MYAIVDIETTGGYAERNRIVEIAIIIHDGHQVVEEYETLINPEQIIPAGITAIHGINNIMVQNAPKFYEVAKTIYLLLENKIFVAHNVNFDYGFIKNEFEMLGGSLQLKKLCTVRLCRKIITGLPSYSLGNLCKSLNINILNRHRAGGDARATAELFGMLLKKDSEGFIISSLKKNSKEALLPANLPKEQFDRLPEKTGVYYFLDEKGKIIYLGKAKNIKNRISGHFSGTAISWSKQNFKSKIYEINYELTGNELIALLLESSEIKKHWPLYNRAQKYTASNFGIFLYQDQKGYTRFVVNRVKPGDNAVLVFKSMMEARYYLTKKVRDYGLCPKLCGLQKPVKECFDYQIKSCDGACIGLIDKDVYNQRIGNALQNFKQDSTSFAIIGKGIDFNSHSIVVVENGVYLGFGYFSSEEQIASIDTAKQFIKSYKDNREVQGIISGYLKKSNDKIIYFNNMEEPVFLLPDPYFS